MKTLFFGILKSFMLIILLTIFLSTLIEYLSTKEELPLLLTDVRTKNIARILETIYSRDKGWDTLSDNIELIGQDNVHKENVPSIRIVVKNREGKTIYNSFKELTFINESPLIEGGSVNILNFETGEIVGTVTAYIEKSYLEKETFDYIISLLKSRIFQGGITLSIALIAALLLSRHISKPIRALTEESERISRDEEASFLPVESYVELAQMSESFNRMIHSLELQRELRKRLISDVSHEILTPLNLIRLEAKGLLDGITLPPQGAAKIIEEVDQMKTLISDLDWLAETDIGEYRLKRKMLPLEPLIVSEVNNWILKGDAVGKKVVLGDIPQKLPLLYIDPIRLRQALGNLIENAFKYSYEKSSIVINCVLDKTRIVISVKDKGPGIPDEDKPYIFERFYRADHARTPHAGGKGLGLSIVKQIINLHGGRVWFTSKKNVGCTFFISLPVPNC